MPILRVTFTAFAALIATAAAADTPRAERIEQLRAGLAEVATDQTETTGDETPPVLTLTGSGPPSPAARFHGNQDALHAFVDEDGTPTLTNVPEFFATLPGYTPIELHFEPVAPPEGLRKPDIGAYDDSSIARLVQSYARRYGVDPHLVYAVIQAESAFNPGAVSPKGARGLMQLMPATAAEMGIRDLFDPAENIAGGVQYLARMFELFQGDLEHALAAYNAGPGAVRRHGGIPPYNETRQYVQRVQAYRRSFSEGTLAPRYKAGAAAHAASYLPPASRSGFVVHFQSGYTQPAERVEEQDGLYILHHHGRVDAIRKGLVAKVARS